LTVNFGEIVADLMFVAVQWAGVQICVSGVQLKFTPDKLAKGATTLGPPFKYLSLSEIQQLIQKSFRDAWAFSYSSAFTSSHS